MLVAEFSVKILIQFGRQFWRKNKAGVIERISEFAYIYPGASERKPLFLVVLDETCIDHDICYV